MNTPQHLTQRLEEIAHSLQQTGAGAALIGLGSVGRELDRLDAYSDLDFFAVVEPGHKTRFVDDLFWLSRIAPIAYHFKNSPDGYKLLFEDGIFCEFAVFEAAELPGIDYAPGRIIWQKDGLTDTLHIPAKTPPPPPDHPLEWIIGEALTNLYVGLGRANRGEVLSATRFIQHYAVDRVLELAPHLYPAAAAHRDIYAPERRFEQRYPQLTALLPAFMQGYTGNHQSALEILRFLEAHFPINQPLKTAILQLGTCDCG